MNNLFDIVIPVGPNDRDIMEKQLKYTKKNIIGYRNIYLICYDPSINISNCITVDERVFPFTKAMIAESHGKTDFNGWYLQQLLKLYAGIVIPKILDRYLVIDCDTIFFKPTKFIDGGKCLYMHGSECHKPYFKHMSLMHENLTKVVRQSGICHHMIFEKKYIIEIIKMVERKHKKPFFHCFINFVLPEFKGKTMGASEYEMYFNYIMKYHYNKIKYRELHWCNWRKDKGNGPPYDFISYHWYKRREL